MRYIRKEKELKLIIDEARYNWLLENENQYVEISKYKVWVENGGFMVDGPDLDGIEIIVISENVRNERLKLAKILNQENIGAINIEGKNLRIGIEPKAYEYLAKNEYEYIVVGDYSIWNEGGMFIVDTKKKFINLNTMKIEVYKEEDVASLEKKEVKRKRRGNVIGVLGVIVVICAGKMLYDKNVDKKIKAEAMRVQAEQLEKDWKEKEDRMEEERKKECIYILESSKTYKEMVEDDGNVRASLVDELIRNKEKLDKKYSKRIEALEKQYNEAEEEILKEENDEILDSIVGTHTISKIKHGELLDVRVVDRVLIVKAKIEPSYSNKATINQNGFNIEDIILNQGGDEFEEIQYWAVAKMEDGSESKVISFTLNKSQIVAVKNRKLPGNMIVDSSEELWVLPSLNK
ncbi:MAG: hypothetical protein ACRDAU_17800 [Clostridium sp.]